MTWFHTLMGAAGGVIKSSLRQIAYRGVYLPQETHSTAKYARGRTGFKLGTPANQIALEFPNWIAAGFGASPENYLERGTGGPMTMTCSIEYPAGSGTFYQGLNSGNPSHTVSDMGDIQLTVSLPITIPADVMCNILWYMDLSAGAGKVPYVYCPPRSGSSSGRSNLSFNDILQFSDTVISDNTMTGTGYTNNGGALGSGYGPTVIAGISYLPAVASIGTSIDFGEGALSDTTLGTGGEIAMSLARDKIPHANYGVRGDRYVTYITSCTKRKRLVDTYFNYIVFGGPTNDLNLLGRTAAQCWTDMQTLYGLYPNHRIIQATPLPIGTTGNVPKPSVDAQRVLLKQTIIDSNVGLYGKYDIGVTVEQTPDSGIWKTSYTTDFVHPLALGYAGILNSGAVDTTIIKPY